VSTTTRRRQRRERSAMSGERGSERIHSVDALRSFLMFAGIFVHAGTLTTTVAVMHGIHTGSALFRMEGFFLLSGFFAAMSLARTPGPEFVKKRMPGMIVPLLVVLPTNFLVLWLIDAYASARASSFPDMAVGTLQTPWHLHLWFLIVLACFAASAPQLDPLAERAGKWLARLRVPPIALAIALVVTMEVCARASIEASALVWPDANNEWLFVAQLIYMPFYLLGMLAWHHAGLREALIAPAPRSAATWATIAAFALAVALADVLPGPLQVLTENVFAVAMIGVLAFAFKMLVRRRTPVLAFLSESVYTAYLLHYLCIWLVFGTLGGAIESYWTLYAIAVVAGFGGPLLIHAYAVKRSDVVGFLLNGRIPKRAPAPKSPAARATLATESPAS
jgi:glucans biosynthesis protein C